MCLEHPWKAPGEQETAVTSGDAGTGGLYLFRPRGVQPARFRVPALTSRLVRPEAQGGRAPAQARVPTAPEAAQVGGGPGQALSPHPSRWGPRRVGDPTGWADRPPRVPGARSTCSLQESHLSPRLLPRLPTETRAAGAAAHSARSRLPNPAGVTSRGQTPRSRT